MILINGNPVDFGSFPNGETLLREDVATEGGKRYDPCPLLTLKYESDEDLIRLYFVRSLFAQARLRIRYMPYSRMDRPAGGLAFTLREVSRFINAMGFVSVVVEEPHSDVTCALLDRSAPKYVTKEFLPQVWKKLGMLDSDESDEGDFLIFPDAGAQKRYADIRGHKTGVAFNERDPATGDISKVQLVGMDPSRPYRPWQALIVDDLVCKGATFIPIAKRLRDVGANKVHLFVAHCEPVMFSGDLLNHLHSLWCTDSMFPDRQTNGKYDNLVLSYPKVHIHTNGHWVEATNDQERQINNK